MSEASTLVLVLLGASTGVVGAMLGLGGGVFLVPLLTLALGVPIRGAVAASLVCVIATASASATVNLNRGLVNLRLGLSVFLNGDISSAQQLLVEKEKFRDLERKVAR